MEEIILYTTDCPKCKILEQKLNNKAIKYIKNSDVNYMIKENFKETPVLELSDGSRLQFGEAVSWVNLQ